MKKTRTGSRVAKRYDRARTPFGRVLESRRIPRQTKAQLQRDDAAFNPVTLGREINRLENKLHAAIQQKTEERSQATVEYISA
ncbi:MAG: hypothetical protein ABFD77_00525 [Thermotogota bacterium]